MRGIDLARFVAIVGMLAVHVGPTNNGDLAGRVYALSHGRASVLFVLLAGVGVSLLAASPRNSLASARAKLVWRAALLLPIGMVLQELDHGAFVILQEYALLFVAAALAVRLPDRWLLGSACGFATVGPVVHLLGQMVAPATFQRDAIALGDSAGALLHGLVLSGPFPLITWAAPFLLGMWLGRHDLRASEAYPRLVAGGALTAAAAYLSSVSLVALFGEPVPPAGWDHLFARSPHSQMPLWLIGSTGAAVCVLGLCLIAADRLGRQLWPMQATGQLALTVYVGHLVALYATPAALTSDSVGVAVVLVVAITAVAMLFATAWRAVLPRGPLETLMDPPWTTSVSPGERMSRLQ